MTSMGGTRQPGRDGLAAGFSSIIVALDLGPDGDRALPVVGSLAEQNNVPVELLTVSSPKVADDVDAYELRRRARAHGWPESSCTILHDENPARGIVDHLARREGALLVMAADKRPLRTRVLGNIGEEVLRTASRPVLLVGPSVPSVPADAGGDSSNAGGSRAVGGREEERNPAEVEHLDPEACWEQLRSIRVGRLAVIAAGRPLIFPVNYVVDRDTIVFRTAPGTKLAAARDQPVAFEIDEYDARSQQATSVIVVGRAEEITEVQEWENTLGLPLFPWDVEPKSHFVRIVADEVSGRRFRAVYAGPGGQHPK
jgi:uncharacterized protein